MVLEPQKELLELARENNKMLHAMRRHQRWQSFFHMLYWLAIIGLSVGSYYFIQPYLKALTDTYQQVSDTSSSFKNFDFSKLFQKQ